MIGSKFSRHFFNQSEVKPKPIVAYVCTFSRALCRLRVITSSFDWFTGLSPSFLICQSNYFCFGFKTLIWKPLYLKRPKHLYLQPRPQGLSSSFSLQRREEERPWGRGFYTYASTAAFPGLGIIWLLTWVHYSCTSYRTCCPTPPDICQSSHISTRLSPAGFLEQRSFKARFL